MTLIYSDKEVKSLSGAYIEPFRFDKVVKGAKVVYTDDVNIQEAYKKIGAEVRPITQPKKTTKKED